MANNLYERALLREKKPRTTAQQENEAQMRKIMGSINRTFADEDGMITLQFILDTLCDWHGSSICLNPETREVNLQATAYVATKREVYGELRKFINDDILKQVEFYRPAQTKQGE